MVDDRDEARQLDRAGRVAPRGRTAAAIGGVCSRRSRSPRLESRGPGLASALGLLLELTGRRRDAPELLAAAARLPRQFTRPAFFFAPRGPRDRALVERRTPEVARAWGWLVNMPEQSFASLLAKHA